VIAARDALVLYLEDCNWSDPSTLDLIATVARPKRTSAADDSSGLSASRNARGKHPCVRLQGILELPSMLASYDFRGLAKRT